MKTLRQCGMIVFLFGGILFFDSITAYAANQVCLDTNKIYAGLTECRRECDWAQCKGYVGNVQPGNSDPRVGSQPYGPATGKWQCPDNIGSNFAVFYGTAGECRDNCSESCINVSKAPSMSPPSSPPATTEDDDIPPPPRRDDVPPAPPQTENPYYPEEYETPPSRPYPTFTRPPGSEAPVTTVGGF